MKNFFDWIILGEKTHLKSGPHYLMVAYIKGHRRRKILVFACFLSLFQASSSIMLLRHFLTGVRTYIFRISKRLKMGSSLVLAWDCSTRFGLQRRKVSRTETTEHFLSGAIRLCPTYTTAVSYSNA